MNRLLGRGGAVEVQAFQRLNRPILADGSRYPFNQLIPVGLCPLRLILYLLEVYRIRSYFFAHCQSSL